MMKLVSAVITLLCWLPSLANAAIALDGHGNGVAFSFATSVAITATIGSANDVLIIGVVTQGQAGFGVYNPITSITDNAGGLSWTLRKQIQGRESRFGAGGNGAYLDLEIWEATWSGSGSITVTAHFAASDNVAGAVWAFSGANTVTPWDVNANAGVTGADPMLLSTITTTGQSTTNANTALIAIAGFCVPTSGTVGIPSSFSAIEQNVFEGGGSQEVTFTSAYQIVTSTQSSLTISWPGDTTQGYVAISDAIQIAGAASSSPSRALIGVGK